jgi:hypothetical protein
MTNGRLSFDCHDNRLEKIGEMGNRKSAENIDNTNSSLSLSLSLYPVFSIVSRLWGVSVLSGWFPSSINCHDNRLWTTEHGGVSEGSAASVQRIAIEKITVDFP